MLSNTKMTVTRSGATTVAAMPALGIALLLAGCASGANGDAPRIDSPSSRAIDAGYDAPRDYPPAQQVDIAQPSGARGDLQGDYLPEPGAPGNDDGPSARAAPGAAYDRPGAQDRPSARPAPARPSAPLPSDAPPAVTAATGPRGTSGDQQRYDAVGYAGVSGDETGADASGQPFDAGAITAAHGSLPLGSIAEVTALDTGRTILVVINQRGPGGRDREIDLSRGAAQQLGVTTLAPVRVRLTNASPQDQMALRSGRPASPRIDAPQSLLVALRRKLPARRPAATPAPRPSRPAPGAGYSPAVTPRPMPVRTPRPPTTSGIFVQIVALSNEAKAQALATSLNGRVQRIGSVFRVQIGPYANTASAQRARDDVARRGYGDARIVTTN